MTLDVDVALHRGTFALRAAFVAAGGITALFGRSGAGKSTLVQAIAGLVRPQRGRIVVDGEVLLDTGARVDVPPHRRRVGYVFQEGRLFPHLSVARNLRYGRWFRPRAERRSVDAVVALLGLEPLLPRRPATLSGGEKQRVAIGRALLAQPRLLLMDEPLAALDHAHKAEILPYVARLRDEWKIPIVYVSHSAAEVAQLATTVVLLAGGGVLAAGTPAAVLAQAGASADEAGDAGAVLDARVVEHDARDGLTRLAATAGDLWLPRLPGAPGTPVRVWVHAADVMLALARPQGLSAQNVLAARVVRVADGDAAAVRVALDCAGAPLLAQVTRRAARELALAPGLDLYAVIKTVAIARAGAG